VRADLSAPQLEAILQFLEVLLGDGIQERVLSMSYAVPVRPSIVQRLMEEAPQYGPLLSMAPRLRFRPLGHFSQQAELILEGAFAEALDAPQDFHGLMAEAAAAIADLR